MKRILNLILSIALCLAVFSVCGEHTGTYFFAGQSEQSAAAGTLDSVSDDEYRTVSASSEVSAANDISENLNTYDMSDTPDSYDISGIPEENSIDETALLQDAFSAKADDFTPLETAGTRFESIDETSAAFSDTEESESSGFSIKILENSISFSNNKLSFTGIVFNNTSSDTDVVVYYAIYSDDGTLVKLVSSKTSVKSGSHSEVSFDSPLDIPTDGMYTERLFIWSNDMKILSDAQELGAGIISENYHSLIISQDKMTLKATETGVISAQIYPPASENISLIFYSADESIATVSQDGTITAVSPGSADIYVYISDLGAVGVCRVTVTGRQTVSVTLSHNELNMFSGKQYFLYAVLFPETDERINWYTSDASVAEVSQGGIVYSHNRGSAVITAEVGEVRARCNVTVYSESDYTGRIAAYFESGDQPGRISAGNDAGGKSYGCFQFSSASDVPRDFAYWIIFSGYNPVIGWRIIDAYELENCYSDTFDSTWKAIAEENEAEFRSCQNAYAKTNYYDSEYNKLKASPSDGGLGLDLNWFGLGVKAAVWSRAIQHGVSGAFNVISRAYDAIGGFMGKSDREIVAAIYAESGALVSAPPSPSSIVINDSTETARNNGLVGKYMKYYSGNPSSIQVGVWSRLNKTEPAMIYDLIDNPPIYITPQD